MRKKNACQVINIICLYGSLQFMTDLIRWGLEWSIWGKKVTSAEQAPLSQGTWLDTRAYLFFLVCEIIRCTLSLLVITTTCELILL